LLNFLMYFMADFYFFTEWKRRNPREASRTCKKLAKSIKKRQLKSWKHAASRPEYRLHQKKFKIAFPKKL
jgi:hypothetical protein